MSRLATQSMLIDITLFVGSFCVKYSGRSFSDRKKHLLQVEGKNNTMEKVGPDTHTLVMTTISSRGRLSCLIAFPRTISD